MPDTTENAAEFGYAGSGDNRSAFPKARVVALSECGTHAYVAAEVAAYGVGEKTLAGRLYPRLRDDELLTADRNFYSWQAWDTGAALLWRAPTQLSLPVVTVLPDGTFLTVLVKPIRARSPRPSNPVAITPPTIRAPTSPKRGVYGECEPLESKSGATRVPRNAPSANPPSESTPTMNPWT